jgi:hypothetical protein
MKPRHRVLVVGATAAAFVLLASSAAASADESEGDVVSLVESASPALVGASASLDVGGDVAAQGDFGGVDVTVPASPTDQISLRTSDGAELAIGLPFADEAGNAVVGKDGIVSYDNGNGSITVPVVVDDGSLATHTIIRNADSPTRGRSHPLRVGGRDSDPGS